jgi:hypothetical protein
LTLAHQTLDQLSPKLRSAILTNTSMKCVGGVSAKDARLLADELRTTPEFIEGMKRRGPRSEFAVWVKHLTGQAIRLSVPLGFLESQPTLDSEDYDALMALNRERYCGTLADIPKHVPPAARAAEPAEPPAKPVAQAPVEHPTRPVDEEAVGTDRSRAAPMAREPAATHTESQGERPKPPKHPLVQERELGKGGKQHRYLQALIKELAEQQGLKATIEAPLSSGGGQVDVLVERDGILAAIEISVTTPVEHERENLRKCLACDYPRVAVVLAKSKRAESAYRAALKEVVGEGDRERVSFLTPEELPTYVASLAPPPAPTERIVKGYRVKGSFTQTSPGDAQDRQDAVARLIAKSLSNQKS